MFNWSQIVNSYMKLPEYKGMFTKNQLEDLKDFLEQYIEIVILFTEVEHFYNLFHKKIKEKEVKINVNDYIKEQLLNNKEKTSKINNDNRKLNIDRNKIIDIYFSLTGGYYKEEYNMFLLDEFELVDILIEQYPFIPINSSLFIECFEDIKEGMLIYKEVVEETEVEKTTKSFEKIIDQYLLQYKISTKILELEYL